MPVIFEPTAPQSNDSTAPSAVIVKVGAIKSLRSDQGMLERVSRDWRIRDCGMAPITGVDQFKTQFARVARIMPRSEEGNRAFHLEGHNSIAVITTIPSKIG